MKRFDNPPREEWTAICQRPAIDVSSLQQTVAAVFSNVAAHGDTALKDYTAQFDGVDLNDLRVAPEALAAAAAQVPKKLQQAIQQAHDNIEVFHRAQQTPEVVVTTQEGVKCWQKKYPIEKVGLYVPGGTAPLLSTVLMLALPAKIAGCKEVVLCTPPQKDGKVNPVLLYTAALCGITQVFTLGGAQAIAAMALGTATVPKVDKIFGPGNQYVTAAKQYASLQQVAIDMPAGPSEVLVAVDASATPAFVAADLLSQAEHGSDSQVVLVTTAPEQLTAITEALAEQLELLPRKALAKAALENSKMVSFTTTATAIDFINSYAPEHYIINVEDPTPYVAGVAHAGSVFIGPYTPESAGDYASGTNHTLPTNGYARQYSGVNLDSFLKAITFQEITAAGLQNLGPAVMEMAAAEGLEGHKNAVAIRLNKDT